MHQGSGGRDNASRLCGYILESGEKCNQVTLSGDYCNHHMRSSQCCYVKSDGLRCHVFEHRHFCHHHQSHCHFSDGSQCTRRQKGDYCPEHRYRHSQSGHSSGSLFSYDYSSGGSKQQRHLASDEELEHACGHYPPELTDTALLERYKEFVHDYDCQQFQRSVCSTCGRFVFEKDVIKVLISELEHYRGRLDGSVNYPNVRFGYSDIRLNGMVLEKAGVDNDHVNVCLSCMEALRADVLDKTVLLSQGWWRGDMTEICLTNAEEQLVALIRGSMVMVTLHYMRGGGQSGKALRGNIIHYHQNPQCVVDVLPWSLDSLIDCVHVVFTGCSFDPKWLKKAVEVRPRVVLETLKRWKVNNPLYSHLIIDEHRIPATGLNEDGIPLCLLGRMEQFEGDDDRFDVQAGYSHREVSDEMHVDFHQIVGVNPSVNCSETDNLIRVLSRVKATSSQDFFVYHHGDPVNRYQTDRFYEKLYPSLFPNGVGGPQGHSDDEFRRWVKVMMDAYHPHHLYQVHVPLLFEMFSEQQMRSINLSCFLMKRAGTYTDLLSNVGKIDDGDLDAIINGLKNGETVDNEKQQSLLRGLSIVGKRLFMSPQEKKYHRQLTRGYAIARGMEDFMLTVNFDDVHHPLVAVLGGYEVKIVDSKLAVPSKAERRSISYENPTAVASFAWESILALCRDLLGYDLEAGRSLSSGGIFGYLDWIIYQIHDQDRGGIHVHLLAKVCGSFDPESLLQEIQKNSVFKSRYLLYVDCCVQAKVSQPQPKSNAYDFRVPLVPSETDTFASFQEREFNQRCQEVAAQFQHHEHKHTCIKKLTMEELLELPIDLSQIDPELCRLGYPHDTAQATGFVQEEDETFLVLKRDDPYFVETSLL
ncbi:hypothetical protein HDU76_005179, partial [Blyttiomyces sp. JEL0837]